MKNARPLRTFITRELEENSPFNTLDPSIYRVTGKSLIQFSGLNFTVIPECSWLFFYSKNGVRFFFENVEKNKIILSPYIKMACIGPGSATILTEITNMLPHFVGNGKAEETAEQFLSLLDKQDKVCFISAVHTNRSIEKKLPYWVDTMNIPVYENSPIEHTEIPEADIYVFTSTLNVKSFYTMGYMSGTQKYLAIGIPTASQLHAYGADHVVLAIHPSENHIIQAIQIMNVDQALNR